MNEKQQQLTFDKGISNKPSDILCDDNCLQESMNIVYRDGEHQPIQTPAFDMEVKDHNGISVKKVLFIHKVGNEHRYIVSLNDNSIAWGVRSKQTASPNSPDPQSGVSGLEEETYYYEGGGILLGNATVHQIQAIGKTLILNVTQDGNDMLTYFLWEQNNYKAYGDSIPEPESIEFETYSYPITKVNSAFGSGQGKWAYDSTRTLRCANYNGEQEINGTQWVIGHNENNTPLWIEGGRYQDFENLYWGQFNEVRNRMHSDGVFTDPFLLRYAVEMVDGTYRNISAPIVMFPVVRYNNFMLMYRNPDNMDAHVGVIYVKGGMLRVKANYDFTPYKDLVKGVSVFVSRMVPITYLDVSADKKAMMHPLEWTTYQPDYVSEGRYYKMNDCKNADGYLRTTFYTNFYSRDDGWIRDELMKQENFYKLADLGIKRNTNGSFEEVTIPSERLKNIEQSIKLDDNLYERHKKACGSMFAYNNRLIVGALKQHLFEGHKFFIGYNGLLVKRWLDVYVDISTSTGVKTVHSRINTAQQVQYFYYYPDPRATHVKIYYGTQDLLLVDQDLKESDVWHGAYFFAGLPEDVPTLATFEEKPSDIDDSPEILDNQLSVSEVDNPWQFTEKGMLTAGTGEVIGFSTYTTALSQGQFGQYPLLIFTTDGVFAASMNAEGVFTAVHPMSREVCNNPESITQTDGAVFFSSEKGLMMAIGNEVRCVSEQMGGHFKDYLKTARFAYDYRDSLLWIAQMGSYENWICNMKDGTYHSGNYFTHIEEEDTQASAGNRAPAHAPLQQNMPPLFNGFISVDYCNVHSGSYTAPGEQEIDALEQEVNNSVVGNAAIIDSYIDYSTIRYVCHKHTAQEEGETVGGIGLYRQYEMIYTVDGTNYLNDYRYIKEGNDVGEGDYVFYEGGLYILELQSNDYVFNQIANNLVYMFGDFATTESEDVHDETYDYDAIIGSLGAENIRYFYIAVVFDNRTNRFLLDVEFWYDYEDQVTHEEVYDNEYVGFFTAWGDMQESNIKASSNYDDGQGHVVATNKYIKTRDGLNKLYVWESNDLVQQNCHNVLSLDEQDITIESQIEYGSWLSDLTDKWRTDHINAIVISNWKVSGGGDIVFNNDISENKKNAFVERRTYSYDWQNTKRSGAAYYAEFDNVEDYELKDNKEYAMESSRYKANKHMIEGEVYYFTLDCIVADLMSIVNNYPDTLFFKQGYGLYSLLNRPQPEDDTNLYSGIIETRPMKLENGLALKSIMQVRHIKCMDGTMTMQIFASNNLKEWVELHSLRGIPWLYYKFSFNFVDMKATDRFAGTMLITQERRTNKMR